MRSYDDINFSNAPMLAYKFIKNEESRLGIIKEYIIRDVFGRLGIYIVTNDDSTVDVDMIISVLNKKDSLINDYDHSREMEKPQLMDFVDTDQIYMEKENEISSFGEFLNTLYENNVKAEKEPQWLLDRHFQFTYWFKENQFQKRKFNAKVVTGYSYKGGMGRSTLIALLASKAALEGKNVVVLDFDFEAPGISNLFYDYKLGKKSSGILDYIIEKPILKEKLRLQDYYLKIDNAAILPSTEKKIFIPGDIRIFPVCDISSSELNNYMQKIARVNFSNLNKMDDNPLIDLIDEIDKKLSPDIIFIDSRTGISDIGGLSLKVLSDLNILIFANDTQNIDGMKAILPLFLNEKTETKDMIVVQSLIRIPPTNYSVLVNEQENFKSITQNIIKMQDEDCEFEIIKMRYIDELLINIKFDTLIEILEGKKDAPEFFINALYADAAK